MWLGSVGGTLLLMIHLLSPHDVLKYISVVVAYIGTAIGSSCRVDGEYYSFWN